MNYFTWKALVPTDIILIITVLVALFGPKFWQAWDAKKQREAIKKTLKQLLQSLEHDLKRIRDVRNLEKVNDKDVINFNKTSKSEVSHYYDYYKDLLAPNLYLFKVEALSNTIRFFDHYKKNFVKVANVGTLEKKTVDNLLNDLQKALAEL